MGTKPDYSDPSTLRNARMTSINCGLVALGSEPMETPGTGNYTEDRREIFKDITNEEILAGIEKIQKEPYLQNHN
jgi:hypothetical protein